MMQLLFVNSESTFTYFEAIRGYIHTYFFLWLKSVITSTDAARNSVTIFAVSTEKSNRIMPYVIHDNDTYQEHDIQHQNTRK